MKSEVWWNAHSNQLWFVEWNPCGCCPNDALITTQSPWDRRPHRYCSSFKSRRKFLSYMKSNWRMKVA